MHGRLVGLALADLDVVPVYTVVADLQRGDAAARAFTCFQVHQELVGVGAQAPQFVELGVVAVGQYATVGEFEWWLRCDRCQQQRRGVVVFAQFRGQRLQAWRVERLQVAADVGQQRQPVAERGQVAWPRRSQRDAGEDALEIAKRTEAAAQVAIRTVPNQCRDGMVALTQHGAVAQRPGSSGKSPSKFMSIHGITGNPDLALNFSSCRRAAAFNA